MFDSQVFAWLHLLVGWLLKPVTWGLMALLAVAVADVGIAIGERFGGLARWRRQALGTVERLARRRRGRRRPGPRGARPTPLGPGPRSAAAAGPTPCPGDSSSGWRSPGP